MDDRSTEGAFLLASLDVDVNPLVIARDLGEPIHHVLIHFDGLAPVAIFVADVLLQRFDVVESNFFHGDSPVGSLMTGAR